MPSGFVRKPYLVDPGNIGAFAGDPEELPVVTERYLLYQRYVSLYTVVPS